MIFKHIDTLDGPIEESLNLKSLFSCIVYFRINFGCQYQVIHQAYHILENTTAEYLSTKYLFVMQVKTKTARKYFRNTNHSLLEARVSRSFNEIEERIFYLFEILSNNI